MFKKNPEVLKYFNPNNQRTGRQQNALTSSIVQSVGHLKDLQTIAPAFHAIAHKHCALGIQPEDYKIVHDNFLEATAEVLGDAVTPDVAGAWSDVLMLLAGDLIGREQKLYDEAASKIGGWYGIKDFIVTNVEQECPEVKSLYLKPADGSALPEFEAGQYVTVCNNPTEQPYCAPRHYTISHADTLRITPKLHTGSATVPAGVMSSFLHSRQAGDLLQLRPPFGEFDRVGIEPTHAEVYVAGGIGVTTCASMAARALKENKETILFHFSDENHHPLINELESGDKKASVHRGDQKLLSKLSSTLKSNGIDLKQSSFFVCGPPEMMKATLNHLVENGVDKKNIRFESFGPRDSSLYE